MQFIVNKIKGLIKLWTKGRVNIILFSRKNYSLKTVLNPTQVGLTSIWITYVEGIRQIYSVCSL